MPTNRKIIVCSPAKINLFLHIHQKRKDGFHHLRTYFQLINLYDELTFSPNNSGKIRVDNPMLDLTAEQDFCYRGAYLLQQYSRQSAGVDIVVKKNIPSGGGLGGGSSNAATVLLVLNRLWGINLSEAKLLEIGLSLGSDVPVFIHGQSGFAVGRGECFVKNLAGQLPKNQAIIVVDPKIGISTAEIFQSSLLTKRSDEGTIRDLDSVGLIHSGENDFESVVYQCYPSIFQVAKQLSAYSPAHLTGTGACLYTVLDDVRKADTISRVLGGDYQVFLVNALNKSPLNKFK
ncbi:MAG: 4-(cytidine 5'-diphospho)-2-C-methyl-D-erythritol kinase [Ostreibacterium sp.]